ncbi:hypothetical protein [Gordonia rhizosphera]|nr:hypothetical protein [Gordonia rhizosphera]
MSATVASVDERLDLARTLAEEIRKTSGRRRSAPVRSTFVRDVGGQKSAPLAKLVSGGGRGHDVALKLYLSLLWRSAKEPFATAIPARRWAELLALPDPSGRGARRVSDAVKTLTSLQLIDSTAQPGAAPKLTLLHESGNGDPYIPPRGAAGDRYFHVPDDLWITGSLQTLSAPAIAMLLAVLVDQSTPGAPVWWATSVFEGRFGLSPATRSRGTKQLVEAKLLTVKRKPISTSPTRTFTADRVRNEYCVTGPALYGTTSPEVTVRPKKKLTRKKKTPAAAADTSRRKLTAAKK